MKLKNILAEGGFDPYVIMNKSGIITNRATKIQAISFARKKAGVFAIPDKPKVLKTAQKLIKKMSGAKLKDAMFDLRFEGKFNEANQYRDVSDKFKDALDNLPEKKFTMDNIKTLIKKTNQKRPDSAMAYAKDAFGWIGGGKWLK